jgi:hypothetical protein
MMTAVGTGRGLTVVAARKTRTPHDLEPRKIPAEATY